MAKKKDVVKEEAVKNGKAAAKELQKAPKGTPFVGKNYRLVNEPEKQGPQVKLIIAALKSLKVASTAQITEVVKGELITRQNPKSVVAFYVTQLKKKGVIEAVAA